MSDLKHYQRVKYIDSYVHHGHNVGVLVEFICDTTIPGTNTLFREHVQRTAMQIASQNPTTNDELMEQYSIVYSDKKISELHSELQQGLDENIELVRFIRWDTEIKPSDFGNNDPPPEASSAALRAVK